jgi:cell division protein FtsZ
MHVNVDFNDVKTVMQDSGVAIMGSAIASGEKRALKAVEAALVSPLLNDNDICGARHVLLNIMSGSDDIEMDEFGEITDFIQEAAGGTAELITGYGTDPSLGDNVSVTIIATGFNSKGLSGYEAPAFQERKIVKLDEPAQPIAQAPIQTTIEDEVKTVEPFMFVKESSAEPVVSEQQTSNSSYEEQKPEIIFHNLEEETTTSENTVESIKQEIIFNEVSSTVNEEISSVEISSSKSSDSTSREEQIRLAQERIKKLKELTLKMKTPEGLASLEKESAWQRKQLNLENSSNPSSESQVSRYTLGTDDNKNIEIRPNNSFLHDNVD